MLNFIKEKRHSLRWIIGFTMTLVSVLTLIVFVTTITVVIRTTLVENSKTATEQSVNLSYLYLKNYHDQLLQRGSIIADEIQQSSAEEQTEKMEEIYQINQDVVSVSIFSMDGTLFRHAPRHARPFDDQLITDKSWFHEEPRRYSFQVSEPHLQDLYQTMPIQVVTIYQEIRMNKEPYILAVDFSFKEVRDYFSRVVIDEKGYVYVADSKGKMIYHPAPTKHTEVEAASVAELLPRGDGTYVTENEQYTVGYRTISYLGWRVIGVSYLEDTLDPAMEKVMLNAFVILIIMLLIIGIAAALISRYIAKPITNMVETMERTEKGNLNNPVYERRFNEVRKLSHAYNNLLKRINELMQQVKEEQAELRKSEINVLQSQINPHFLYNTLDSILWMSNRGNNQAASEMTSALGKLLRISLSKGENLIPLQKEMEHAENYLAIQKIRYDEQFTYDVHMDEGLGEYRTVKLIIQPFLENALYHGIERMIDEGHIAIRVLDKGDDIKIEIEDDGMGIPPEKVEKLNQPSGIPQSERGIGVRNVNQRLNYYFGEAYGVVVTSELDEGTVVTMTFPKIKSMDELDL